MNPESSKETFSMLKKPLLPPYTCLPEALPGERSESGTDEDSAIPGFDEFRKYKRVNETRVITPYKPESVKKEIQKQDTKVPPLIEIEDAERFVLAKIKSIRVESLESLVQMIRSYPDLGFVTMNRCHMDFISDYQPYNYTICNYNDIDKTNYVTISLNGLLEVYKGDADFMALDRLLVEYEIYHALQKIPLFSVLNYWKAFMVWLEKVRRRKFMEAKAKIEAFFEEKYKSHETNKDH